MKFSDSSESDTVRSSFRSPGHQKASNLPSSTVMTNNPHQRSSSVSVKCRVSKSNAEKQPPTVNQQRQQCEIISLERISLNGIFCV